METKICKKCGNEKEISMFAKYRSNGILLRKATCRECYKPSRRKHYINHATAIIAKNSDYKKQNRPQINERERGRRKNDIEYKLYSTVRSVVKMSIKRNKGHKGNLATLKYLTYSIEDLKHHLEKQFESWMTWQNWGVYNAKTWDDNDPATWTWHVDHITPQSDLPYTSMKDDNFTICWALENLRPLNAKQNISEGPARIRHKKAV